jgi:hypothetical protein
MDCGTYIMNPIEKTYTKEVKAIQWTGEESVLQYLQETYSEEFKCWRTGDGSLRVSLTHYQGDWWLEIGDYLIHSEKMWEFCSKNRFEAQYNEDQHSHNQL